MGVPCLADTFDYRAPTLRACTIRLSSSAPNTNNCTGGARNLALPDSQSYSVAFFGTGFTNNPQDLEVVYGPSGLPTLFKCTLDTVKTTDTLLVVNTFETALGQGVSPLIVLCCGWHIVTDADWLCS